MPEQSTPTLSPEDAEMLAGIARETGQTPAKSPSIASWCAATAIKGVVSVSR